MKDMRPAMKKIFLAGCVMLLMVGAPLIAAAQTAAQTTTQTVCPVTPEKIKAIVAQYPDGGAGLSAAIAKAVEADPCAASAVVTAALGATPAQQQALGAGLALAVAALNATGTVASRAAA